jgi:hypothetical protein
MIARKPNGTAGVSRRVKPLPLRPLRKRLWDAAQALFASGEPVVATLARRFELDQSTIETVLVAEGLRHERTAVALKNGIVNALAIARDAADEEAA